ncbi:MAG: response regulator [Candidatus Staskawiczbacteria bacterium]|nr:response regulator [Candidatus Staskawiczbacteria bacterium]
MKKILIVEDDAFLRDLINKKLSSAGFEVSEAIDGEKGLEKTKEEKPDLILLDLLLPTIDGFEVLAKLKESQDTSAIPVIVLSNLGQKEDVDKGLSLGATDYLIKAQFTPEEIILKVKEAFVKNANPVPEKK